MSLTEKNLRRSSMGQFHRAAYAKKKWLRKNTIRLFFTCYWQKCRAIYIACDWFSAVVYFAKQLSGVLAGNLILPSNDFFA